MSNKDSNGKMGKKTPRSFTHDYKGSPPPQKKNKVKMFNLYKSNTSTNENYAEGNSLVVEWLRLRAPNAGGLSSIPGQGSRFHVLQLRFGRAKGKKKKGQTPKSNTERKYSVYTLLLLPLLLLLSRFSRVRLCATPEMAVHQAPLSLGFSRQEHWSGLPFPSPMHESEK